MRPIGDIIKDGTQPYQRVQVHLSIDCLSAVLLPVLYGCFQNF